MTCALTRCPWCGHERDCKPGTPGNSPHHRLCCLDQYNPECRSDDGEERAALTRIMREEMEDRNGI